MERINVLDDPERVAGRSIRRYPALAYEDRTFSALFMTRGRIRRFLNSI